MSEVYETTVDALTGDPRNANQGTARGAGMLEDSLQKYGAGRSVLLDKHGTLIAGNKTWEKAGELGMEGVIVVQTDGTQLVAVQRTDLDLGDPADLRARELAVADNAVGAASLDWDPEVLRQLAEEGTDMNAFFTDDEFEAQMARVAAAADDTPAPAADPADGADDAPDPETVPTRVKPGDIWACGEHRIGCLDSRERENVLRLFSHAPLEHAGNNVPAMVWADPPYGVSIVEPGGALAYGGVAAGANPNRKAASGRYTPIVGDDTTQTATDAYDLAADMFPDAVQIWWGGNYYAHALPPSPCWLVWDKQMTGNFADAELAWTNLPTAVRKFVHQWNGMLRESERGEPRVHPTQKPVALAEWAFGKYGGPDDLIFDPFLGSGISVLAAEKMTENKSRRVVLGCDLAPACCDMTLARWEALTGDQAVLLEAGEAEDEETSSPLSTADTDANGGGGEEKQKESER